MANCTEVDGTMTFQDEFYEQNQELIEDYFSKAKLSAMYGIDWIESSVNGTFSFGAEGRWSMEDILDCCLQPVENSQDDLFDKFYETLRSSKYNQVEFDYTDYDSGDDWLVHQVAIVTPLSKPTKDGTYFTHQITSNEDLPTDDYSLITSSREDGILLDTKEGLNKFKKELIPNMLWERYRQSTHKGEPTQEEIDKISKKLLQFIMTDFKYKGGLCWYHEDLEDVLNDIVRNN